MTRATGTRGRGRPRKRTAILRAAVEVFLREGYDRASVDDIATAADVAKRTIYNHLGDKEALFLAAFEDAFARVNTDTLAALDRFPHKPQNLETELVAFGHLLAGCYLNAEATALRQLMNTEAIRHPELITAWRERGPGRLTALLADRLENLTGPGDLTLTDPLRAAHHLMALATHEVHTRSVESTLTRAEINEAVSAGVRVFLRAYTPAALLTAASPTTDNDLS